MLPTERKAVEPLVAHADPWRVSVKHQSLHHVVARPDWSNETVRGGVREWVSPALKLEKGCCWIVADAGFPKRGENSDGVAREYCGQPGKHDNSQVAVILSLASAQASLPIVFRLYWPEEWASDKARRDNPGVPAEVTVVTKPRTVLKRIRAAKATGVPVGVTLGDAGYGNDMEFRAGLRAFELKYRVEVPPSTTVWTGALTPLLPKTMKSKQGHPATRLRRAAAHETVSVKDVASEFPRRAWRMVGWREGSHVRAASRFAALREGAVHQRARRSELREPEWLVIAWPESKSEPVHDGLHNFPAGTAVRRLVTTAMTDWGIDPAYQYLRQSFGLSHYAGRGRRGFDYHVTLCIGVSGLPLCKRTRGGGGKKLRSLRDVSPTRALPAARQPAEHSVSSQTPSRRLATCWLVPSCSGATAVHTARYRSRSEAYEAVRSSSVARIPFDSA